MKRTDFTFESKFKYDKAKLEKVLKRKVLDSQSTKDPEDAYIKKGDDNSYVVVKETTGDAVEEDKIDELYSYVENQTTVALTLISQRQIAIKSLP